MQSKRIKRKPIIITPDGEGHVINVVFRKNTNGGPGCKQYLIQLLDGRKRKYNPSECKFK